MKSRLLEIYKAMRARFGYLDWWPGDSRLEICIGAILTQNTNWKNVEKAIGRIKDADAMDLKLLQGMNDRDLAELIRPAGYYNVKADRLKQFFTCIINDWQGSLDLFLERSVSELRKDLLAVKGIGPETADSIILYAAELPSFVVDAYTKRIFVRHELIDQNDDYDTVKSLFESNLPEDVDLWNDYHAQIVETGKNYCRKNARCEGCPLVDFLPISIV